MWHYLSPPTLNELYHYGILGMKWGVRRYQNKDGTLTAAGKIRYGVRKLGQKIEKAREDEKAYRDKLTKIIKRYDTPAANRRSISDVKRMKYRNQPLAVRAGKTAAGMLAGKLFFDMMTGKISEYKNMSRGQIAKELIKIARKTATKVAINDALAKSASKNYDETGKIKKGVNTKTLLTKEDVIQKGIKMAVLTAPVATWALATKAYNIRQEREMNEARFKSWGSRILPEKVEDIIWLSKDEYYWVD
mgnify:CR=1 FL=1